MWAVRCARFAKAGESMQFALKRELFNLGHENWDPFSRPEWVLLELESDLLIRPIQVKIAEQMMSPPVGPDGQKHGIVQLNMGEGKTVVIVPMIALAIADGTRLCRLSVLRSLFRTNLSALRYKLGGLLNRRVYTLPCNRDFSIRGFEAQSLLGELKGCMEKRGVLMVRPEQRLSFQLKCYDQARKKDFNAAEWLLAVETFLRQNARDILDEAE